MFLSVCKAAGWNALGMEPDDDARKIAGNQGLNVAQDKQALDPLVANGSVNAITLWHVLEHVTDMDQTLTFFKNKLAANGVLIIAVPNYTSYDAQSYQQFWAAYDVPRHLHHFSKATIEKLLMPYGFNLVQTKPMKFDSYYVSMLSEKYKTGSVNLLKAFFMGLKSNMKAKDASHYSSVIYIFKKA